MLNILTLGVDEEPGWFTQAVIDFFFWLINWLCILITPYVTWILEFIPPDWITVFDETIGKFAPFLGAVNSWIALDWAVSILASWILFMVAFILVKLTIKLFVPTVG